MAAELTQRREAVDLGGLNLQSVLLVDLADPGHSTDRVQSQVDKLHLFPDLRLRQGELLRQQLPLSDLQLRAIVRYLTYEILGILDVFCLLELTSILNIDST